MSEKIRIAVVDDHPMLREGVVRTLNDEPDIEVVGEGGTADEALAIAQKSLPDIILLDMNMPGSGLTAIERISDVCPAVKLIVLTVQEDHDAVTQALERGARGYILKGVGASELVDIVRAVNDGGSYVSPSLAAKLLSNFGTSNRKKDSENPIETLTAREEQILELLGKGLRNKEIGLQLDLKEKTVKHYVTNILQKLQLRNRVEAALLLKQKSRN
jgi:two-component system nitrate/nitrite response regulator NarL